MGGVVHPPGLATSVPDDALGTLAARVRPVALARQRQLPVLPALGSLLADGALRRGSTVSIAPGAPGTSGTSRAPGASGGTALALALAAGPSQAGSWVAAVGLGSLGLVAASEMGVALDRLALVDEPEPGRWAAVVAALVDGFDVVLVAAGPRLRRRPADARRLVARARERGAVLVAVGGDLPERSHVRLSVAASAWEGIAPSPAAAIPAVPAAPAVRGGPGGRRVASAGPGGGEVHVAACGHGRLWARRAVVEAGGRGEASRARRVELWLPDHGGEVTVVAPVAPAVPLPTGPSRSRPRPADPVGPRPGARHRPGEPPSPPASGGPWGNLVGAAG